MLHTPMSSSSTALLTAAWRASKALAFATCLCFAASPSQADMKALEAAARTERPMTWYISFYGQEPAERTAAAFAKAYPGLSVIPIRTTTGSAFQRLTQDFKSNAAVASVVSLSAVGGYYDILLREDRLANYVPETADKLSPSMKAAIVPNYIYPIGAGLMAIAYNTSKISAADAPKTWRDLADPKWKGRLALSHPAFSGFDAAWVVALNRMQGWAYFDALAKNDPLVQRSTFDTLRALNSGERAIAATADMIVLDSAAKGNPVTVVYPSDGAMLIPGQTAILKNAPHPNTARLFTEFLLGVEHAQIVSSALYQSARPEVVTALPGGKGLADIKIADTPTSAETEKELPPLVEKWRDSFGQ